MGSGKIPPISRLRWRRVNCGCPNYHALTPFPFTPQAEKPPRHLFIQQGSLHPRAECGWRRRTHEYSRGLRGGWWVVGACWCGLRRAMRSWSEKGVSCCFGSPQGHRKVNSLKIYVPAHGQLVLCVHPTSKPTHRASARQRGKRAIPFR
uniref:Uncharacterized protein n=1 Tax=Rodentolepis nana TaxID=102285 RepID=A0A0R3TXF6_RODNA